MHENARPHIARIALNFLKENNIEVLPHPAMSSVGISNSHPYILKFIDMIEKLIIK